MALGYNRDVRRDSNPGTFHSRCRRYASRLLQRGFSCHSLVDPLARHDLRAKKVDAAGGPGARKAVVHRAPSRRTTQQARVRPRRSGRLPAVRTRRTRARAVRTRGERGTALRMHARVSSIRSRRPPLFFVYTEGSTIFRLGPGGTITLGAIVPPDSIPVSNISICPRGNTV